MLVRSLFLAYNMRPPPRFCCLSVQVCVSVVSRLLLTTFLLITAIGTVNVLVTDPLIGNAAIIPDAVKLITTTFGQQWTCGIIVAIRGVANYLHQT